MVAVFRHELRNYSNSVSAYLFCAFFLVFVGIGAMLYNIQAAVANFEYVLQFVCIGMTVIVPILTMRSIAEERKQKTDQLLYSLPLKTWEVVVGKYLALLVVFLVPMLVICAYPIIFAQYGEVYMPAAYGSIFAFYFMGAAMIAIGMFCSSLTENIGFAAGISIAFMLLNYFSTQLASLVSESFLGGIIPKIAAELSLFDHFYYFVDGVFDITSLVFFITVAVFFIFITIQSMEKRRYA